VPPAREETVYDRIGGTYTLTRTPDSRIARLIEGALADSVNVVNVGAGTGAYEPRDRRVVAIEPSETMVRQRPSGAAPAVIAFAESLPLCNDSVDAALAILTVHHWDDPIRGLSELRRVARDRVVVFTCDPRCGVEFWLWEYLQTLGAVDRARQPPLSLYQAALGELEVIPVAVPHDCTDGFLAAYWRRPEAYLSEVVRANISTFSLLPVSEIEAGLARLANDLDSGAWDTRFARLREQERLDVGYRLLVANLKTQ
jgi:SAM-dependent methyltransferase